MKSYTLSLANGQSWNLTADGDAVDGLVKFASALGIKEGKKEGSSEIVFEKKSRSLSPLIHGLRTIYQKAMKSGGLVFHAGLIVKDGVGVVLCAPGGTGKTTCCNRVPPPWKALADEEVLVIPDSKGRYFAHPFPNWFYYFDDPNHKYASVEESFSLKAIFFLEQAKTDEAIPAWSGQAAVLINSETKPLELKDIKFDNAATLAKSIPCFILRNTLEGRFWEVVEKTLAQNFKPLLKPRHEDDVKFYSPKLLDLS